MGIQHHSSRVVLMMLLLRLCAAACCANEEVIVMMMVERAWSAASVMRIGGGPYSSCSLHLIKLVNLLDLLFR